MTFETHILPEGLASYVEAIFHFKDFVPDHSIERVVPTGHTYIIFELDDIPRNTFDNDTLKPKETFTKVWVSGPHRNYISISAHKNSEMFVIQFKPFGAFPFLQLPLDSISEKVVHGDQIMGGILLDLREELVSAGSSNEKFQLTESWLLKRLSTDLLPPSDLLEFYSKLEKEPYINGHMNNGGSYPNSQKHLIDQFKKYVGLNPKYTHRIIRFNEILAKIQNKEKLSWASIAYECGFSDQSYFIKEFKHFSGFNPQEFIDQDRQHEEPNFFPLDHS